VPRRRQSFAVKTGLAFSSVCIHTQPRREASSRKGGHSTKGCPA
jgi:hypothetical protein